MRLQGFLEFPAREFKVASVDAANTPDGADGTCWFRYVIARENSTIVGFRSGTLFQVSAYAREFAENLNERAAGRGQSRYWVRGIRK